MTKSKAEEFERIELPVAGPGTCPEHKHLAGGVNVINRNLSKIFRILGSGEVSFATIDTRLSRLERVVYGAAAAAAFALIGYAVVAFFRGH